VRQLIQKIVGDRDAERKAREAERMTREGDVNEQDQRPSEARRFGRNQGDRRSHS
jgi:hypothetical protein